MSIKSKRTSSKANPVSKLFLIAGVTISLAIAVTLFIALFSYNIADPAWSHNSGGSTSNSVGVIGAWYSDLSFSIIGKMSYFVPFAIIAIAIRALFEKGLDKELLAWQITMLFIGIIAGTVLFTKHDAQAINSVAQTGGGALGAFLTIGLEKTLSVPIIMLITAIILLTAISLLTGISWIKTADWIGQKVCQLFGARKIKKQVVEEPIRPEQPDPLQEKIKFLNTMAEKKQNRPQPDLQIQSENHPEQKPPTRNFTISENKNAPIFDETELVSTNSDTNQSIDHVFDNAITKPAHNQQENTIPVNNNLTKPTPKEEPAPTLEKSPSNKPEPSFFDFSNMIKPQKMPSNNPEIDTVTPTETSIESEQQLNALSDSMNAGLLAQTTPSKQTPTSFDSPEENEEATPYLVEPSPELFQAFANEVNKTSTVVDEPVAFSAEDAPKTNTISEANTPPQAIPEQITPQKAPIPPVNQLAKIQTSQAKIGKAYQNDEASVSTTPVAEKQYKLPSINFLDNPPPQTNAYTEDMLAEIADKLETTLKQFKLDATVMHVSPGPVITRFEIDLAPGVQAKKITALSRDLARALAVTGVRVEEVIPGSSYVGLEVPNLKRQIVYFKDVLRSRPFQESKSALTLSLGSDISGKPVIADLTKMPHLLVAGTTGSGKSVAINVMLLSMLYKASPKELRLILVDPKMLEMSMYEDIPHLLTPVITDMNDAENALTWAVAEMERRYQLMAALKVRKIEAFNQVVDSAIANNQPIKDPLWDPNESNGYTHQPDLERLPFIVIVIDELADMMMVVGKQVEQLIARLTQKARAAGIHVILATQRPSVDVLTGLIKANVPTRIAFQVSSKIDSRTIIDGMGAEALLGHGDMLYVPPGVSHPQRLHGAYINDEETDRITSFLRESGEPNYINGITAKQDPSSLGAFGAASGESKEEEDPLYQEAIEIVITTGKASISSVQRQLRIGYNRAARMIEEMQAQGIVSEPVNGIRRVIATSMPPKD